MALGRLFRGLAENLDQTRRKKIANMGGLEDRMDSPSIPGSFTFPGGFNFLGGGFIPNIANIANIVAQQQEPVLGPDDFGSYVIPASDPTYSSGFDYARSIAGGMPMSQVIAPGVSYSPEQPMGYTQEQLNTAIGTTPTVSTQEQLNIPRDVERLTPPRFIDRETNRDRFSINRLPGDLPDFAKLGIDFVPGPEGAKPGILGNIDFSNLPKRGFFSFDPENFKMLQNMGGVFDFDQDAIDRDVLERPMISGLENRDLMDVDSLITGVPTGRDFTNLFGMPSVKPPSQDLDTPYRLRPPIGGGRPTPIPLRPIGVSENNLDVTTVKPPSEESDTPYRLRPPIGGARPIPVPPRSIEELTNSVVTGGMIPLPPGPTKAELFAASQEPEEPYRLRPPLRPELTPTLRSIEELIAEGFIPPQEPISVGGVGGISGPTPDIRDLILPPITSIENIAQDPRLANIPISTPPIVPPMDMPPVDFPPIVELPPIRGIGRPNKNRFSIQQLPRGLF